MRFTTLLGGACAAVVALSGSVAAAAAECPCGFVGADCTEPGFVNGANKTELVAAGTLKHFPGANDTAAVCNAAHTYRCGLSGTDTAKCFCRSGWTGPTCEEMVDVLEYSLVVGGFLLPLAFFALSVWLVRRYDARTGNKAWSFAPQALTDGMAGKHVLLVYRVVIFVFAFATLLRDLIYWGRPERSFQFFTIWTFTLLIVLFGIGSALSALACFTEYPHGRTKLNRIERVFYVMVQVELPTTFLIALIVWMVLFPASQANGTPEDFVNFGSLVMHGANVPMMLGEFALNGMRFRRIHLAFSVMWGCLYLLFTMTIAAVRDGQGMPETPPYAFLTASTPLLAVWVCGLLFVISLFFTLTYQLNRCKRVRHVIADADDDIKSGKLVATPAEP